jgi:hypothetical protein
MYSNDEQKALENRLRQRGHTLDSVHIGPDRVPRQMVDGILMDEHEMIELDRRERRESTT